MANPALESVELAVVRDIKSDEDGSTIQFLNGPPRRLAAGTKDYERSLVS